VIYKLELENFYSFRDKQILDLSVPLTAPSDTERFGEIFAGSKIRAPKVVALFGANASGKSTILKAISFISWFVTRSFEHSGTALPIERFNDLESSNRPVRLAIEFGGALNLSESAVRAVLGKDVVSHGVYRYELELEAKDGFVGSVNKETLFQKPNGEGRWHRVFDRQVATKLLGSKQFSLSGFAQVIGKVPVNASVVSTLAKFRHQPSQLFISAANKVLTNILVEKMTNDDKALFALMAGNPDLVSKLNTDLQRIDIGIEKAEVQQTATGPTLVFNHEGHGGSMPWILESNGTRSFISVFPLLSSALTLGGVAVLDELDISIHPLILPEIIRWFYSKSRNPNDAQLFMSCHAVSLLEELSKEEIVMCEKDRQGRSTVYSLTDVKPTLRKDNYYRKYMGGEYGAVPRIG
jgi:uncharacterized protein